MKYVLLPALALSLNTFAGDSGTSCKEPIQDYKSYKCRGLFVAKSQKDLERYKADYGHKKYAKHLFINFDLDSDNIDLSTPCRIILQKKKSIISQNACLRGEQGIYFRDGANLQGGSFELFSQKRIAIRKYASVDVDKLRLQSEGSDHYSRVHIRKNSFIKANELSLDAHHRATLGMNSEYIVKNITLNSRGEGFSAVWRNTSIQAETFVMNAAQRVRFGRTNHLVSDKAIFSAETCDISESATLEAKVLSGSCYPIVSHDPTVVVTSDKTSGKVPLFVNFDISQSFDEDDDIVNFVWDFGDGNFHEGLERQVSHTFMQEGLFTVTVKAVDSLGNIGTDSIQIDVWVRKAPTLKFKYHFQDDGRIVLDLNGSYDEDGRITRYIFDMGNGDVIRNPFLKSLLYGYREAGTYTITVGVEDDHGTVTSESIEVTIDEPFIQ